MTSTTTTVGAPENKGASTVAEALGQIVWLLEQSSLHRELKLKDLSWSIMPAVASGQFRIFRFGPTPAFEDSDPGNFRRLGMSREELEQLPLGLALWARLSKDAEIKLEAGARLSAEEWTSGDRLWLVEMISPFATAENKLTEVMLLDLVNGPFKDKVFNLHQTDPSTGVRVKVTLGDVQTGASQ
jgi:cytolysin-activating lysine-acyltransferase